MPSPQSIVRILHISDIHRGASAPTSNLVLLNKLLDDIQLTYSEDNARLSDSEPHLGSPDVIVVSGDITQSGAASEFTMAREFLDGLVSLVGGDRSRIVLVPGNHDVNWTLCRTAYVSATEQEFKDQAIYDEPFRQMVKKERDAKVYWRKTEEKYSERFKPFKRFFDRFYRGPSRTFTYSLNRDQMYTVYDYSLKLGLVIVGFSTCDEIDHLDRRAFINTDAIFRAKADPAFHAGEPGLFRIAVFHHNIRSIQRQEDFLDPKYLQILKRHGFHLCIHGHVHTAGLDIFDPTQAITLPILGAGSLAAPYQDRPPAMPIGYNLIVLNRQNGSVLAHTRRHDENHLVWAADHQWEGKPYVTIYPPGSSILSEDREAPMSAVITIIAPDRTRYEADVILDLLVGQLKQAFLTAWEPPASMLGKPHRYLLRPDDPGRPPLEPSLTLREAGVAQKCILRLAAEPLKRNDPVSVTIEDEQGRHYTTAVVLDTAIGQLSEAFLQDTTPGSGQPAVEVIGGVPGWTPHRAKLDASLYDEGIGDDAMLLIYRDSEST